MLFYLQIYTLLRRKVISGLSTLMSVNDVTFYRFIDNRELDRIKGLRTE